MENFVEVRQCCGCNNWRPDEGRSWLHGKQPPRGVCTVAGVYKEADQTCIDWAVYETPMTRTQRALWELSHYSGWSDEELGLLFEEKEAYVVGCIKSIKNNHKAEIKKIHDDKLKALAREMALYTLPIPTQYLQ